MQHELPNTYAEFKILLDTLYRENMAFMTDNKLSYDLFYDTVARLGDDAANDFFPAESRAVKAIEERGIELAEFRAKAFEVLVKDLTNKIKEIADARDPSITNIASMLRHDLQAVDQYRLENCDGINGKMWYALTMRGMHQDPSKNKGLADELVKAWTKHLGLDYKDVSEYVWIATDLISSYLEDQKARLSDYPGDLAADLDEYASWPEVRQSNIELVRALFPATPRL